MKKVKYLGVAFAVALFAISFSSCTQNNEDTKVHAPKIISMNFATSEEAYLHNDYLPSIARAGELYIGFELSDEDKDIKEIFVHADTYHDNSDATFPTFIKHQFEIPSMDSATTSYGFYITVELTRTFIFYAYVRDSYGNISETIKKTITLVPYAPEIISMEFAASEEDYKQGNYITSINENEHFYIGFKIKDENKDATEIYLCVGNSSETTTIPIDDMPSEIWTGGIDYTFLEAGEFTFTAYVVDSAEKTSSWMSKTITIISSKPKITSINFADDEANYKLGKYIPCIYKDAHRDASFYIGFTLFDNQKDITNIHFTINSSEEKIHSIYSMENQTYSTGFAYALSETGTFTISAYAEDAEGNYSETIEKEFTVIPHTPKIKSSHFALSERNYLLGNYITKLLQDKKNTPLYLGLEVEDYGRDITKIDIVVKDYYDNELSNGSYTINVDSMPSETWTGGIDFSLSRFELLNWYYFHISVEDKDGNKTSGLASFQIDTTTIWNEIIYLDTGKSITKSFTLDKATTLTIQTERVDDNGKLDSLSGGRGLEIYLRDAKGLLKFYNTVTGYLSTSIKCAAGTYECEIKDNFVIQHNNFHASKNVKVLLTKQN